MEVRTRRGQRKGQRAPPHPPGHQRGEENPPGGQKGKTKPHKGARSGGRGRPTQGGWGYPHAQPLSCMSGLDASCEPVRSQTGSAQERKTPTPPTCLSECEFVRATPRPGHEASPSQAQGPPSGRPQGNTVGKGKAAEWTVIGSNRWPATSKGLDVANPPRGYGSGGQPQLNLQAREGRHRNYWSTLQSNSRYRSELSNSELSNSRYRNGLRG